MIALITACALLFIIAVTGWSLWLAQRSVFDANLAAKQAEFDAYKKVGGWYEDRVAELENETRALAEQVVASGAVVRHAMPIPPEEPYREYRSDPTGLFVEAVPDNEMTSL